MALWPDIVADAGSYDTDAEAFELHEGQWMLIATAKDADPVCIRPFDAVTFSLGDLWP